MTQQSHAAYQRRRNLATLGLFGALLVGAGLAAFSDPGAKQVSKEPAKPAVQAPPSRPAAPAPARPRPEKKKPDKPLIDEKVLWVDPPEWKRLPQSGMRYASYEIPAAKGDSQIAELNVFILSGDVEDNIQRWVDEFTKFDLKTVVRSKRTVNDLPQAIVEIPKGYFSGGMGDTKASDNYGLLGAIVVAPSGAEYFFKLTGPSKTVKAARKPFYQLLDSIRVEKSATKPAGAESTAAPSAATPPAAPSPAPPSSAAGSTGGGAQP
jgi:hypothetical protein